MGQTSDRSGQDNKKIHELAGYVLDVCRNRLLVNLRYMDVALTFHQREEYSGSVSTDGRTLYYDPVYILKTYHRSREEMTRCYLHLVLHCVFHHMFIRRTVDRGLWDLACDIAVESTVDELDIRSVVTDGQAERIAAVSSIRRKTGFITAEKIYTGLSKGLFTDTEIEHWKNIFILDDHAVWYVSEDDSSGENAASAGTQQLVIPADTELEAGWKEISEQIEMDIEMFAKVKGKYASSMIQNLRAVNREHYDYSAFLRKFASSRETLRVSEDEFDYIYYTYGLSGYGNMPLIEPLEYRDDKRIHDFVIAVDTSGSVAGEEVREFLQKTYNILKSRESFRSEVNVHIIQCDAEVQSDTVIRNQADLERYVSGLEIRGLGGTDFRPVFIYVDELLRKGEFSDLRGLLYFTDGLGTFPDRRPEYKTAFVFIESGYNIPEVPPWAVKVILQPEEALS